MQQYISFICLTIFGSRFSTSWGWKTVMRASVLTALLLSFCPTISVTSSGLSSKWLMSDWHSPRMALTTHTHFLSRHTALTKLYISLIFLKYLWWSGVLGTGTDPTPAPDCVSKPLVFSHLGETHCPLPTHAHCQSPAAGIRLLHIHNLEGRRQIGDTNDAANHQYDAVWISAVLLAVRKWRRSISVPLSWEWWHGTGFPPGWRNTGSSQTGISFQVCWNGWKGPTGSFHALPKGFPLWEAWKVSGTARSLHELLDLCNTANIIYLPHISGHLSKWFPPGSVSTFLCDVSIY